MKDRVIEILSESDGYVSGEEISRILGVSRTAVWKNINSLREEGYVIDSVTNKGYMLRECPDLLDAEKLRKNLGVDVVGTEIEVLKCVDSTNDEVKRRASDGGANGLIIAAEEQTGGKGRLGRSWSSDSGGLFFSILLRPELPPSDIASITLAAGYAVCLAIRRYTGLDARIKWPNDIVIGNKKAVGILTEMAAQSDMLDFVSIGIGINVNTEAFPEEIKDKATSLFIETGKKTDRNGFFREVIYYLDAVLCSFMVSLYIDDMENFKRLCVTLGKNVSVTRNGTEIRGTATDITATGELVVRDSEGHEYHINSGEVAVQGIY